MFADQEKQDGVAPTMCAETRELCEQLNERASNDGVCIRNLHAYRVQVQQDAYWGIHCPSFLLKVLNLPSIGETFARRVTAFTAKSCTGDLIVYIMSWHERAVLQEMFRDFQNLTLVAEDWWRNDILNSNLSL
eukprot:1864748-Amphidinium_carterae.2